jgi:dihydrofolate synthase/folylpolyglutamate synthase
LGRVRRALAVLGHPEDDFASVLIAGTNGKGSTAALVESVLREAGHRTGLYTSPHLVDVTERVRVRGRRIPARAWAGLVKDVSRLSRRENISLTEFEIQTLAAFGYFAREKVEIAVVEAGLGGRLDAANALPAPEVTVITSIGLDHTRWLGNTLPEIYFEKYGIARPGTPLLQALPRSLWPLSHRYCREMGVPEMLWGREIKARSRGTDWKRRVQTLDISSGQETLPGAVIGLMGPHQRINASLAVGTCWALRRRGWALSDGALRRGLARASWPGRFEVFPGRPDLIVDGAHNPAGGRVLVAAYRASPWGNRKAVVIFGCLKDKDAEGIIAPLASLAARVITVPLATERGRNPEDLARLWRRYGVPAETGGSAAAAWRACGARVPAGPVLAAGSLYLAGDMIKIFRRRG